MRLEIKLKQHTPMIHFQPNQNGATLRASEFKPRFDAFLIKIMSDELKGMYVIKASNGESLPYSLKIKIDGKSTVAPINDNFPCFFGNMRSEENKYKEKAQFVESHIILIFDFYYEAIKTLIESNIGKFLLSNNFGARQSKGFGSFYLYNNDLRNNIDWLKKYYKYTVNDGLFEGIKKYKDKNKYERLFSVIDLFYRTLRSGINEVNRDGYTVFYFKSFLFSYAKSEKKWMWDKKVIKSNFVHEKILEQERKKYSDIDTVNKGQEEYLIRSLLGHASLQEYKINKNINTEDRKKQKKQEKGSGFNSLKEGLKNIGYKETVPSISRKEVNINNSKRYNELGEPFTVRIEHYCAEDSTEECCIERYKSPIIFKPIEVKNGEFDVYLIINPIEKGMFNQIFQVSKIVKNDNQRTDSEPECFKIITPSEFDIEAYLRWAIRVGINEQVESRYRTHENYKVIERIYKELKVSDKFKISCVL